VLAQREVNGAPGEVPGFQPLLADLELAAVVVTADALHTHAEAAEFLVATKHADYLLTVKANQPALLGRCQRLAWHNVPVLDRTRDPRPRPHRAADPQGGLGRPLRVPPRSPGPPGHPQEPRP
jgi:hypothetical protein